MAAGSGEEYGMIEIIVDDEYVADRLGALAGRTNVVITRAANVGMRKAAVAITNETYERNALRKKDIREILSRKRASYSHPVAKLTYRDAFKNLVIWSEGHGRSVVKPYIPHIGYSDEPKNYFGHVKRRGGDKALEGEGPIPFIQIAKGSGNMSLFTRLGRSRYPIRGVAAPAIPQVIAEDKVEKEVRKIAFDATEKELERQIALQLKNGGQI